MFFVSNALLREVHCGYVLHFFLQRCSGPEKKYEMKEESLFPSIEASCHENRGAGSHTITFNDKRQNCEGVYNMLTLSN